MRLTNMYHQSQKVIKKMHLIGCCRPQIILIVTSICKDFEVKFIICLEFSNWNYLL